MPFIRNGPDVPECLLQAHEDGCVVFFCGAGISRPAGLPDFEGLAKQLYADLWTTPPRPVQQAEIDAGRFDAVIGLLEDSVVGGRETVRRKLAATLEGRSRLRLDPFCSEHDQFRNRLVHLFLGRHVSAPSPSACRRGRYA